MKLSILGDNFEKLKWTIQFVKVNFISKRYLRETKKKKQYAFKYSKFFKTLYWKGFIFRQSIR